MIGDVVGDVDFDALVVTEAWLTGGDVTSAGYSFRHVDRTHRKCGEVGIRIRDSLKFEKHYRFLARPFENYHLTFISSGVSVWVAIMYRLHPTEKNGLKAGDFCSVC